MNAVKRAARRYHLGKQYGTKNGVILSDNRNFRKRNDLGVKVNDYDAMDEFWRQLDKAKNAYRLKNEAYLDNALRTTPEVEPTITGFVVACGKRHIGELNDGQLEVLAFAITNIISAIQK